MMLVGDDFLISSKEFFFKTTQKVRKKAKRGTNNLNQNLKMNMIMVFMKKIQ